MLNGAFSIMFMSLKKDTVKVEKLNNGRFQAWSPETYGHDTTETLSIQP